MNEKIVMRIRELLKEKNLTIPILSKSCSLSQFTLYDILNGRTKQPKISTIKVLCSGLGITLSEFFNKDYFNEPIYD